MNFLGMEGYESLLAKYTSLESREILGAIGLVIDGSILYHRADGKQSLSEDAPALNRNAVFELGSAGKLFIHIAALQCVERGLIGLDEPVYKHLPELEALQIMNSTKDEPAKGSGIYVLQDQTRSITLRQLLTHSSGIGSPSDKIFELWQQQNGSSKPKVSAAASAPLLPLVFNPGDGWAYGSSINWTTALIKQLIREALPHYVQTNIFDPLGMKSSTFSDLGESTSRPDLRDRKVQMIVRQEGSEGSKTQIHSARRAPPMAPATSAADYGKLIAALMSLPGKQILGAESVKLLFSGQLSGKALQDFRADTETYAAPTGLPPDIKEPKVNFTVAGALLVEEPCPFSAFPSGTLTWNGMPNVIWSVNRERKRAAIFATQLLPVDDKVAVEVAMDFFRRVWGDDT